MNDEKRYPPIDEEDGSCMGASEPAVRLADSHEVEEDDIDYNFGSHDFGNPHTLEELKAELTEAESHRDDPDYWITSEQVWADIKQQFPWANIR